MANFLSNTYFKDFFIPLISVFLTVFVKVISRKDSFLKMTRDDFAIGFDLSVSALIVLTTYASKIAIELNNPENAGLSTTRITIYQDRLGYIPWMLLLYTLGLWGISIMVRIWGWEDPQNKVLHKIWGVSIPTIIGIIALYYIVNFVSQ